MHIPNSTFAALPHVAKPKMTREGKMTGNINAMFMKEHDHHHDHISKEEEANANSVTKI